MKTIYQKLKEAGQELEHHESDLYVKQTPEAIKIIREYTPKLITSKFISKLDNEVWINIPFCFDPFWEKKDNKIKLRLEYLREQIRGECISYGELLELQSLKKHIEKEDVELLEWAGVKEN